MKKRSLFLTLVLALMSVLLSGCLSVLQEMWVNPDGSAKVSIDMGIATALLDMGGSDGNPLDSFKAQYEGSDKYKNVTTRTYDEGDLRHIVVEFEVDSFEQFIANPGGSTDQSLNTSMALTKLDNGNYKWSQSVAGAGDNSTLDQSGKDSLKSMFKDKYWTTRIHVPQVVSTNGTNSGSVAEWKVPIADIMLDGKPVDMALEYSLTPGTPGWLLPVIIAAVVLIAAVVVFLVLRRKKPAPALAYPQAPVNTNPPDNLPPAS